ncbi:hypothetical protein INT43_005374 [Umbelopsis isabellina]|uniref:Peptidase S59 domain-containing protein n=1 Tax=Mortierella isabellina TaxID=91625 RepID=A0A8H7PLK1_MORIS|nr:hypothetical protein INT43_005374 [Umbelopsis isabellina]
MFGGGSAFGSSAFGQQPQQQQQQQQTPLFGQQPQQQQSAFGGFGQTSAAPSAFGAANTGMSGFGAGASNPTSAFGGQSAAPAFGSANNATSGFNARPSAFGSSAFGSTAATQQPASSGFGFGSSSTAAPTFGAAANNATSGGLFGSRPATTSAFGSTAPSTGGVFGSTPAASTGYGASASTPFGSTGTGQVQGTVNPEFTATVERDTSTGVNNQYQTITAMPAYRNYSVEELRVQDYQAGRKNAGNAAAPGGTFGSTGGFGAQASTPFGQSSAPSAFGAQPSTSTAGSAFGQSTGGFGQSTGAFGQSAPTGGFGATNTGSTGGLFGQQPASTASAFGSTPAATSGFGGSAFGQPQQQQTTGFGSTPAASGFGASAAAKPFSFGQTPATSQPATGFGATGSTGFGQQPQQQQQQPSVGGLFGQAAQSTPSFGQPQSTGTSFGFGAKPATSQPATGFGGFGASTANKPATGFSFGASTTTTPSATATSGFGGFGGATGTAGATGFGSTGGATGGLFGAAKPAASTGLFGNTQQGASTGFGGFGAANTAGTAGTGGLFGAKPATTGLSAPLSFGAGGQTGGLFGGQQNTNATGSFNLPATGGLTTFGTTGLQQQPNANQPPLYASLDKYPYGYNPLFENLQASGGTAERSSSVAVSEEPSKKLSTTPHFLLTPRAATRIKLRGYSFTPAGEAVTRKTSGLDGISDEAVLRPEAFAPRPSIKRLIVNKKVSPTDVSNAVNGDNGVLSSGKKSKALFDPHLEMIATQHGVPGAAVDGDRPQAAEPAKNVNRNTAFSDEAMSQGYYIKPSLQTLGNMSIQELKKVQNLVVGLKGVGEITFDGPVDLSEIDLDQIMVGIVNFQLKTCTVYPDENAKPPRGKGLNVPATIKLEKCYPCDKTTKQPITDPQHPRVIAIIKKLREVPETEFIDFEASTGTWTFKVQHF